MKIRGDDQHGSGGYRAPRGGRLHNGIDICCKTGAPVKAVSSGVVTKIGYPYDPTDEKRGHLRYVEITDDYDVCARYFYTDARVMVGERISRGLVIALAQGLADVYPGITEHYHFEVLLWVHGAKVFLDPEQYILANETT